jgi:nicotinate-nucleotide adenylyltransferase
MKTKELRRIGIFGGSFDPPHLGHLIIAEMAREVMRLDRVIFVPARRAPHKRHRRFTSARHRLRMTSLAISGHAAFVVSDIEVRRAGISYTVHTLHTLHKAFPHAALYLIIGEDNYRSFATWRYPEEILSLAELIVYPRTGKRVRKFRATDHILRAPLVSLSSSEIRRRISSGLTVRYLVPDSVRRYIEQNHLYKKSRRT